MRRLRFHPWRIRGIARAAALLPLFFVALAAALLLHAEPAHAHGGVIAPPPNPQAKGPPGGGGGIPNHADPGFGGPIVTPGAGGAVTPRRASRRKTPITPTFETSWQLWWQLHRDAFLPARSRTRAVAVTPLPAGSATGPTGWEARRRALAEKNAVPALHALLKAPKPAPADVRASALIALGKIAHDEASVDLLLEHVEDARAPDMVRESAALALGLLRRSDPALRLKPIRYEIVRGRLLKVFDQYVGGKKLQVPTRTRAFAMYAIGLLGDQPFRDDPLSKDGRLISKLLWERLEVPYKDRELHIALLTALGRQPRAGIPSSVQNALRDLVAGRDIRGHRWDVLKRAHAATAVARLGGFGGHAFLLRLAGDRRKPLVARMAASLALGERAGAFASAERGAALRVMRKAFALEQELLAVGLANLAMGRLVGADLDAGSTRALDVDKADVLLLERAEKAPWYLRGFALLGLALAARGG
ncbi:MAG: HEAT repeat domain-containing protein, partial [Planctomycetota bacterium]|nr:HEAT repeat domain-containing protein [Planctomycetota bacterium]